jgi:deoxycytidylate deaminase
MQIIESTEEIECGLKEALVEAQKATCTRSKVGSVIVNT